MRTVTADAAELLRQASGTAHDYLRNAVTDIDRLLGEDYAAEHPELIAAYMQTAAIDFATAMFVKTMEQAVEALAIEMQAK